MTPFEEELKRALMRREPSEDFAERVLAQARVRQVEEAAVGRWPWLRWTPIRVLAMVAALLFLPIGASVVYQRHERIVRGEAAKGKLLLALQIAGSKLHNVQQHVTEMDAMEIEQ